MKHLNTVVTGVGSYVPTEIITNEDFARHVFYDAEGVFFNLPYEEIAEKFVAITGIEERRYVSDDLVASDIGAIAAERAIQDAGVNKEELDQIIVAQNFGDVRKDTIQTDIVPSLAARIKHSLQIENPNCIAYDLVFGCPGWIQGVIQADSYIRSGMASKCLIIGTETLSRVVDIHDRDSMIYSDGAGACILEKREGDTKTGILSYSMSSHTKEEANYLFLGKSNIGGADPRIRYVKMYGRKIYEFALSNVPAAMKLCLERGNIDIHDVKKIFIHQANEKLDMEVIKRLYRLYKIRQIPERVVPMNIHKLGNSSVATVPTLIDMVIKEQHGGHKLNSGDIILLASVGAGMNINAVAYKYEV